RAEELARLVGEDIYEAGFAAVKRHFGQAARTGAAAGTGTVAMAPVRRAAATEAATGATLECRAVVLRRHGGPEVMAFETVSVPPPGAGEIRIRHTAIGVNYIDVYCRSGYFHLLQPPGTPGMEGAGIVMDIGPGV